MARQIFPRGRRHNFGQRSSISKHGGSCANLALFMVQIVLPASIQQLTQPVGTPVASQQQEPYRMSPTQPPPLSPFRRSCSERIQHKSLLPAVDRKSSPTLSAIDLMKNKSHLPAVFRPPRCRSAIEFRRCGPSSLDRSNFQPTCPKKSVRWSQKLKEVDPFQPYLSREEKFDCFYNSHDREDLEMSRNFTVLSYELSLESDVPFDEQVDTIRGLEDCCPIPPPPPPLGGGGPNTARAAPAAPSVVVQTRHQARLAHVRRVLWWQERQQQQAGLVTSKMEELRKASCASSQAARDAALNLGCDDADAARQVYCETAAAAAIGIYNGSN